MDPGRLVTRSLDPVLVPAGFLPGQGGAGLEGDVQVIFCTAHDELSRRYSRLPQASPQPPGACVDLVVEARADGTLARLDLEDTSLEQTLLHAGLVADGAAVSQVGGRPLGEGLPVIEAALRRLFGDPAWPGSCRSGTAQADPGRHGRS